MPDLLPVAEKVDIMLLLEGTFPYVSGGVSSWVNQIIRGFPEIRFGAVFIGSTPHEYGKMKYELPSNLVHLQLHYLHGDKSAPPVKPCVGNSMGFETISRLHGWFRGDENISIPEELKDLEFYRSGGKGVDYAQFLYGERSWEFIGEKFEERCTDPSFVDYFWTVRNMHGPVWQLAELAADLIPAGCYHTVSTGYAGFLGSLLHYHTGRPLILSEHGIYTKERRIDIFNTDWIKDNRNALQRDPTEVSYYRDLWIRFFETMGAICYDASCRIVSLFEGARQRQIIDGAPVEKTLVVPNGIDVERYLPSRAGRPADPPMVIALLGRVVPIKDVKTFIRAVRILVSHIPELQGWVVGPDGEDPGYAAECRALAESLAIGEQLIFKGFMDPRELFPQTGLLVLSSISEGLPLVALEGYAAGLPMVATDVGSCRQLVEGVGEEDTALGPSGGIVQINSPQQLAEECLKLLKDRKNWDSAQNAAIARVEKFYTQKQMFDSYKNLYEEALLTPHAPSLT